MFIIVFDILESNFCPSIAVNLGILMALVPFSLYLLFKCNIVSRFSEYFTQCVTHDYFSFVWAILKEGIVSLFLILT